MTNCVKTNDCIYAKMNYLKLSETIYLRAPLQKNALRLV